MIFNFDDVESSNKISSSSEPPNKYLLYSVVTAICCYFVFLVFLLAIFIKFIVNCVKVSRKDETEQALLGNNRSQAHQKAEKPQVYSKVWNAIYYAIFTCGILFRIFYNTANILLDFNYAPEYESFLEKLVYLEFFGYFFAVTPFVLVIAIMWRIYFALSDIRRDIAVNMSPYAAVPTVPKTPRFSRKLIIPSFFGFCLVYLVVTVVTLCVIYASAANSESSNEIDTTLDQAYKVFKVVDIGLYSVLALTYIVYAVCFFRLFKMSFYNQMAHSMAINVVVLCVVVGFCFFSRSILLILNMANREYHFFSNPHAVIPFFLAADIIPLALTLVLQLKSGSTTKKATEYDRGD